MRIRFARRAALAAYGSKQLGTDPSDTDYLQGYGPYGFFDALDPVTGAVGHRYLDLDQSMIMAALDDVLDHHVLQQRWAADQVGQVDARYLRAERFSVAPEH